MDSRNLDHINYSYTDSERAKRNALKNAEESSFSYKDASFFSSPCFF